MNDQKRDAKNLEDDGLSYSHLAHSKLTSQPAYPWLAPSRRKMKQLASQLDVRLHIAFAQSVGSSLALIDGCAAWVVCMPEQESHCSLLHQNASGARVILTLSHLSSLESRL